MFLKKYRPGFDIWALLLFLIIMIPNIIWFIFPAPNDILREEPATVVLDTISSIFQVLMLICLFIVNNKEKSKFRISELIKCVIECCLLYFLCWILYYLGFVYFGVVLGMAIFPCLAFFIFALDRKNIIAAVPVLIFSVCHITYAVINYLV